MLRINKNVKGQAIIGEYVLVFFIIVGMMTAMTVYIKRTIQARIYDAQIYGFNQIVIQAGNQFSGNIFVEYEPYYVNTVAQSRKSISHTKRLLPAVGTSGIYEENVDEIKTLRSTGVVAPPKDAPAYDVITPVGSWGKM